MSDPFFQRKRKRSGANVSRGTKKLERKDESDDDDSTGAIDDLDLTHEFRDDESEDDLQVKETPAEAKVRLARLYLDGLRDSNDQDRIEGIDAAAADRENIAARLQKDVQEHSGRMHVLVADRLEVPSASEILCVGGHRLAVTSAKTSARCDYFFTADKQGRIVQWRLRDGKQVCIIPRQSPSSGSQTGPVSHTSGAARRRERERKSSHTYQGTLSLKQYQGHTSDLFAIAISDDGKYLVSGGSDRRIGVWRIDNEKEKSIAWVRALSGHKDAICGLAFRGESLELLSASRDRTVKLFDVSQLSYIETLFGHQEAIEDLSCLRAERAVTAGGRERTCRLWKIREESQLVFRGGTRSKVQALLEGGDLIDTHDKNEVQEGSLDCVTMIDDHHFISGSDAGTLSLWSIAKKKPVFSVPAAHGFDVHHSETEGVQRRARYITSVGCLPYGDVFASGSWDGHIRVWKIDTTMQQFSPLFTIPAAGFVNCLQMVTPSVDRMTNYPVNPAEWRRHGSPGASIKPNSMQSTTDLRLAGKQQNSKQDHAAHRVLGQKESIPPLLIAGVGQEPKFSRWFTLPDTTPGAMVVPLWFTR
ncbi:pre-rRNA processing protein [Malassezia psittaci]|uniref:Pre-rRNA processing protein n=1 Tax=Malassezia psittaci TaxID=1821823 RepID=A0AAF0F877_9BASI|nr:pre-rRNA processing protein [Malassezia psittaci]